MKNALRLAGDGVPLAGREPADPAAGLAASGPPRWASQRWKAFALLVVTYFIAIVDREDTCVKVGGKGNKRSLADVPTRARRSRMEQPHPSDAPAHPAHPAHEPHPMHPGSPRRGR